MANPQLSPPCLFILSPFIFFFRSIVSFKPLAQTIEAWGEQPLGPVLSMSLSAERPRKA
jgi:hypothetical protein